MKHKVQGQLSFGPGDTIKDIREHFNNIPYSYSEPDNSKVTQIYLDSKTGSVTIYWVKD